MRAVSVAESLVHTYGYLFDTSLECLIGGAGHNETGLQQAWCIKPSTAAIQQPRGEPARAAQRLEVAYCNVQVTDPHFCSMI